MVRKGVFLLAAFAAQPALAQDNLSLICEGMFRGNFKDGSAGVVLNGSDGWQSGSASSSSYRDIPTIALFRLEAGTASLNLPQPPTCSICVGEKGWRDVKDLEMGDALITGRIRYGIFSATEFEIDRRTGIMTSKNGFTGMCQVQDLSERRF